MVEVLGEKRQAVISRMQSPRGSTADVPMKDSGVVWLEGGIPTDALGREATPAGDHVSTRPRSHSLRTNRRRRSSDRLRQLGLRVRSVGSMLIQPKNRVLVTVKFALAIAKASICTACRITVAPQIRISISQHQLVRDRATLPYCTCSPTCLPSFGLAHAVKSAVPGVDQKDVTRGPSLLCHQSRNNAPSPLSSTARQ